MEGMGNIEKPAGDAAGRQAVPQAFDLLGRTRGDAQRRRVDGGEVERFAQLGAQRAFGQADRQHGACRQALHEGRSGGDQAAAFLEGEDVGQAGSDEFTDAVADHGGRSQAPGDPELCQRIFEDEQRGLGE